MAAYMIVEVEVHDPVRYADYRALVPATLVPFQGRFIVRGGATTLVEGGPQPQRLVVLEFPDAERARAWWASDEYAGAKALRRATSTVRMVLVEGFEAT